MNDRVQLLLEMQRRAFRSSPWHGLMTALEGITEQTFQHIPDHHAGFPWMNGSVANIVYHVSGDKLVQLSAAFGGGEITWDNLTLTKGSADEMLRQLEECNHAVEERLKRQTDESLKAIVASWGGKKMTAENLFLMLIEHDLYHAGQVRYIRNLLEKED